MTRFAFFLSLLAMTSAAAVILSPAFADQGQPETVFGQSLMSTAEIAAHKERIASCKSVQERADVESDHKDHMIQRARWKGMVLDRDARKVATADNN